MCVLQGCRLMFRLVCMLVFSFPSPSFFGQYACNMCTNNAFQHGEIDGDVGCVLERNRNTIFLQGHGLLSAS